MPDTVVQSVRSPPVRPVRRRAVSFVQRNCCVLVNRMAATGHFRVRIAETGDGRSQSACGGWKDVPHRGALRSRAGVRGAGILWEGTYVSYLLRVRLPDRPGDVCRAGPADGPDASHRPADADRGSIGTRNRRERASRVLAVDTQTTTPRLACRIRFRHYVEDFVQVCHNAVIGPPQGRSIAMLVDEQDVIGSLATRQAPYGYYWNSLFSTPFRLIFVALPSSYCERYANPIL